MKEIGVRSATGIVYKYTLLELNIYFEVCFSACVFGLLPRVFGLSEWERTRSSIALGRFFRSTTFQGQASVMMYSSKKRPVMADSSKNIMVDVVA